MASEWDFSPDVIANAKEVSIGNRVAIHWSEAEGQDQEGTVVGVEIGRYGKVGYTVHIDGDASPTDGFTHDRMGHDGGTIRLLGPAMTSPTSDIVASAGYRVGNPFAWQFGYDEAISEEIRALLALISSLVAERDALAKDNHEVLADYRKHYKRADEAERLLAEAREALKDIAEATDADNPESYRADDREGCLDTVHAIAASALGEQQ